MANAIRANWRVEFEDGEAISITAVEVWCSETKGRTVGLNGKHSTNLFWQVIRCDPGHVATRAFTNQDGWATV
jgi:hypothetical protein